MWLENPNNIHVQNGFKKFECEYLHFTTSSIVNTEYDLSRHLTLKYIPSLN